MSTRLWRRWRKDAPCVSPPDSEDRAQMEEPTENAAATDAEKANLVVRQIDRWIASMERLRLRTTCAMWTTASACSGPAFSAAWRAGWAAVGFTILGALLVDYPQDLARP